MDIYNAVRVYLVLKPLPILFTVSKLYSSMLFFHFIIFSHQRILTVSGSKMIEKAPILSTEKPLDN